MTCETARRNYLIFLVIGSGLVTTARAMTLTFLAIKLQQNFGLSAAMIGVLLGSGPLAGAVVAPVIGSLSDNVGRKTILTLTLCSMAGALIGMGIAETVLAFCLAQLVSAVAIAVYEPVSRALMSDVCPEAERLKFFSWRYSAMNAGFAIGPLIGIAAGAASSMLFLIAGAAYAAFALAVRLIRVPQSPLNQAYYDAQSTSVLKSLRAAINDRRLAFFVAGGTLLLAVHGQWSVTLAPYLSTNVEGGVQIFAYLVSINGFVVLFGNPLARRFINRFGARNSLTIGCLLFLIGELAFIGSAGLLTFAAAMVIFTIGEILVVPSEYMLIDNISNDRNRGSYFGAHTIATVGNFIGPAFGGIVLSTLGGPAMFLVYATFAAASAALFYAGSRMPPPKIIDDTSRASRIRPPPPSTSMSGFGLSVR